MCNLSEAIEEEGIQKGREQKFINLICRKVRKGKALQVIAEELEEEVSVISPIYDAVLQSAPDYDCVKARAILFSEY